MTESEPHKSSHLSDEDVKGPSLCERAKEEIEAMLHNDNLHHHHHHSYRETHGLRDDLDETTPINDVKAPNVFERVKEEIEALVQTIHHKKEPNLHVSNLNETEIRSETVEVKLPHNPNLSSDEDVKAPSLCERAKEGIEAMLHDDHRRHHHSHSETHGLRDDLDESTPINDVKAPNVFERVKEEIEALVQTIHPKKEPNHNVSNLNEAEIRSATVEVKPLPSANPSYEKGVKLPNIIEKAKEELEAIVHKEKSRHSHQKETHGKRDDIDEYTPINKVKGPNVFERAKEEIEALVQTIHPKKES